MNRIDPNAKCSKCGEDFVSEGPGDLYCHLCFEVLQRDIEIEELKSRLAEIYESGRKDGRAEIAEARDASCRCLELHMENERLKKQIEEYKKEREERLKNEWESAFGKRF